jgi:hypothetical protein
MAADSGPQRDRIPDKRTPWYLQVKTLVITAGALAVALLAVLNFWDRVFPPNLADVARIESIERLKMTPLSDFASEALGEDVYLEPAPEAAGTSGIGQRIGMRLSNVIMPSGTTEGPTPIPTPTPTDTRTPTDTPTPTPTPTPTDTSTPSPTKTWVPPVRPTEDYIHDVAEQRVFEEFTPAVPQAIPRILPPATVDEKGEPITPKEAADELVDALADVELKDSPTGVDALGWTIAVGLSLEGLANQPLLLTWSLDGVEVPHNWKAQNLAYRIIATTDHDTGTVKIWVPDLKGPGPYNVNVDLVHESDGSNADTATPLEIP